MTSYVEERDGGYYLTGSRVSLDSIVHEFRNGSSAETIQQEFATLTLEQVYGAIAFYLAHRAQADSSIDETQARAAALRGNQEPLPAELRQRLERARQDLHAKSN